MRGRCAPGSRGISWGLFWHGWAVVRAVPLASAALAFAVLAPTRALLQPPPQADGARSLPQLKAASPAVLPTFTLPDLNGTPLKLDDERGRIVVVHFFATWCEPCREELGSLSQLQQGRLGTHLSVVAVNVAEVPIRVKRFLDTSPPVSFKVVLDADRAVTRGWGVGVLPTTYVLDADLTPKLFVEGDLDWSRPDVLAALDAIRAPLSSDTSTTKAQP
jgi:thiol-disulfide isomerase/thioredoxin